ncbi:MAG: CcmD family protein [Ferruginibacter sp.]
MRKKQPLLFFVSRLWLLVGGLLSVSVVFGQVQGVEMADTMRSNGKIYVVVAVCLTILLGLFIYVFTIDRKISRLEKDTNR